MSSLWSRQHSLLKDLMKTDREKEEQQKLQGNQIKALFVRAERATEAGDWRSRFWRSLKGTGFYSG